MAENSKEAIRRYLEDAVAAENGIESQLRSFAEQGDDEEVQALFAEHALQTSSQVSRLNARLQELGGSPNRPKGWLSELFSLSAQLGHITHAKEERLAQNLVLAYSMEMSECAMYEALASAAQAAGDSVTNGLANEIAAEERAVAAKIWHLLPSRSKIAFNVLTAGEVDPAIETRAPDDRLL